ncbi:MAG: hypothetical protein GY781_20185 [Gammaproteobacteria bacterium]|nr:hypothetical protein [Gammaproteobacteria bacterium]
MKTQWIQKRAGATIRFVNSWFGGAKLYINGELKDFDKSHWASSKYPLLSGSFLNEDSEIEIVEVYVKAHMLSVGVLITINGEEILNENF